MKKILLFVFSVLTCLFLTSQSISCNSIEGDVSHTDIEFAMDSGATDIFSMVPKKDSVLVCKSKSAYAYHKDYCSGLRRCKATVVKIPKSQAQDEGYRACKNCY